MGRYLQESYDKALREIERLREENNALAAQVALTGPALREARTSLDHARVFISSRQKMHEHGRDAHDECIRAIDGLIGTKHETSFARLKAQWQAEALTAVIEEAPLTHADMLSWVDDRILELRRQAEEK